MSRTILTVVMLVLLATAAMAAETATQDINITVTEGRNIAITNQVVAFTVDLAAAAGAAPVVTDATNEDNNYLKYSVIADAADDKISVKYTGTMPGGLSLKATATVAAAYGESAAAGVVLTDTNQDFITKIGSCATGVGETDGALVVYELSVVTPADLLATAVGTPAAIDAVYTFTDL